VKNIVGEELRCYMDTRIKDISERLASISIATERAANQCMKELYKLAGNETQSSSRSPTNNMPSPPQTPTRQSGVGTGIRKICRHAKDMHQCINVNLVEIKGNFPKLLKGEQETCMQRFAAAFV
jgi:hypothetical protein